MPHTFSEASRLLAENCAPAGCETIATSESLGRVLAADLYAPRPFPDIRKSAVDGYAVAEVGAVAYALSGVAAAGGAIPDPLAPTAALAVMTGAPLPENAKAVLRVEEGRVEGASLYPLHSLRSGENIVLPGEEMAAQACFARSGTRIDNSLYPVLFAAGCERIPVFQRPRVGILVTGDELLGNGEPFRPGGVYDANRYILESVFRRLGVCFAFHNAIGDSQAETTQALDAMLAEYDLIVTSGGVSMGRFDYIRATLEGAGYERLLSGTRIKPGRPLMVARRREKLIFAMPGYPAALTTNLFLYLVPVLKKMYGSCLWQHQPLLVPVAGEVRSREGRFEIHRARVEVRAGHLLAQTAFSQKTSHFLNFAEVNALLLLDESRGLVAAGDHVPALLYQTELNG